MERLALRLAIAGKKSGTGESHLRLLARDFRDDFDALVRQLEEMRSWWNIKSDFEEGLNSKDFYGYDRSSTYFLWSYENYLRKQRG
jgi:hypothetical protein